MNKPRRLSLPRRRTDFLDSDGVLIYFVQDVGLGAVDGSTDRHDFYMLPGVAASIAELNCMDCAVVVIWNPPEMAKGKYAWDDLCSATPRMQAVVNAGGGRIDAVYYCCHHPDSLLREFRKWCLCREPESGLLLQVATDLGINPAMSFVVGSSPSDMAAGEAVGALTILIDSSGPPNQRSVPAGPASDCDATDLAHAVQIVHQHVQGPAANLDSTEVIRV